jgi:hypothetical protein
MIDEGKREEEERNKQTAQKQQAHTHTHRNNNDFLSLRYYWYDCLSSQQVVDVCK